MKLTTLMAAVAAVVVFSQSAQAHPRHFGYAARYAAHRHVVRHLFAMAQDRSWTSGSFSATPSRDGYSETATYRGGVGARPAAWCGWEMRQLVGGDPGPEYNLARNWAHWGHAGPAGVGAVVVWAHHVGKIVGEEDGRWLVESGNDGHAVRTRARSIAGAIAIRWG